MKEIDKEAVILIAEDDDDDFILTEKAFRIALFGGRLIRVRDGVELLGYFQTSEREAKLPLLVLDLNMPRKDGRDALREIRGNPSMRGLPIVVLTTSGRESDVRTAYELGANTFIKKPAAFDEFVRCVESLHRYWFEVAELPKSLAREVI